jgi:hypothetical protein
MAKENSNCERSRSIKVVKFQTFAQLILSYIVSYTVKKIDLLYFVFSGQGCGGQQTFPYRRKKIERAILYFR